MKVSVVVFLLLVSPPLCAQLLPVDNSWVRQTLKGMSLEEKIGQLFIPAHTNLEQTMEWVKKYGIGGIWFSRVEAKKIAEDLNTLQQSSKYPLLVTADFEKGAGTYVDGATDLPINMALGATRDPKLAYQAATLTAKEARALGVHLDYAPVLDVNNNPKNPVINTRSYGEDPKLVATFAAAAIRGYQDHGLLATGKHFPGHGNTSTDTHAKLGVVMSSAREFNAIEMYPYRHVLRDAKPSSIMSTHLWVPAIDADTIPATLSKNVMTNLLRGRLKFDGIILTDAMVMGGITTRYTFGDAAVKALQAGCDIILFPSDLAMGIDAVRQAVERGELTEKRIDESVQRILRAKTRVGLQRQRMVDVNRVADLVGTEENYRKAKEIAAKCITLAKNDSVPSSPADPAGRGDGKLIPIQTRARVLLVTMSNKGGNSIMSRGLVTFPDEVRKLAADAIDLRLSDSLRADEVTKALDLVKNADVVIVAAYIKIVLSSGTVDLPPTHASFLRQLLQQNPHLILVSFGNPYIGASVPEVPAYICAYDNAKALQEAAAEAMFGKTPFKGRLPVTVSPTMKFGVGLTQ